MARIPTVAAPGQAVGTVKTGFTPQPFQRLNAPIEAFGGGAANTSAQLGQALSTLGADLDAINKQDDKISSLKMQAEIDARTVEYQNQISSVEGQERLDMLSGTHSSQMGGGYSLEQQYQQDLKNIRSSYQFATNTGGEVADIAITASQTKFTKDAFVQGLEARKLVQKQTVAAVIGEATVSAVQGVTDAGVDEAVLKTALGKVTTAVTDPEIGMAEQAGITDPEQIKLLVKEQQALVISKVFDELVSRNNLSAASALIETHTKDKGILAGSSAAATLQAKILPYTEEVKGRTEFSKLVTKLGASGSNPLKVLEAIDAVKDPVKYARLTKQYTSFYKMLSAKRTEAMNGEISRAFAKLAKGEQVKYLDIPTLAQTDPRAAAMFVLGKGGIEERTAANQLQARHKADGGGSYNVNMDSYMSSLSKVNPQGYLDMVKSKDLKGMVSADQLAGYRDKAIDVQKKIDDSTQGAYNIVGQLKTRFRFNDTKAGNLASQKYIQITKVINDTRREIFERTGKSATTSEIDRAVATMLIEFETDRMLGTGLLAGKDLPGIGRTDLGANFSTQLAIDADDVPSDSVRLRKSEDNMYVISAALGVGYDQVKGAMDDEGMSLKELAQKLDVQTPQSLEATQEKREEWQTLSYENGIAFSFMEDAFRDNNTAWTTQNVKTFLRNVKGSVGQATYNKWLETR